MLKHTAPMKEGTIAEVVAVVTMAITAANATRSFSKEVAVTMVAAKDEITAAVAAVVREGTTATAAAIKTMAGNLTTAKGLTKHINFIIRLIIYFDQPFCF